MKQSVEDQVTRQKMETLGTLGGGIVFGKEEAWEKLQGRLEKGNKPFYFRMWPAAAALFIAAVGFTAVYYSLPKSIVAAGKPSMQHTEQVNPNTRPVMAQPLQQRTLRESTINEKKDLSVHLTAGSGSQTSTAPVVQQSQAPGTIIEINDVPAAAPGVSHTPARAVKPEAMRVIFDGDLEREREGHPDRSTVTVPDSPPVATDLHSMPVNYIGDVEQNEIEFRTMLRESPKTLVRNFMTRPVHEEQKLQPNEYTESLKHLKSIFNLQN